LFDRLTPAEHTEPRRAMGISLMKRNGHTTHFIHRSVRRTTFQLFLLASLAACVHAGAQPVTIPLDSSWTIADSVDPNVPPSAFDHMYTSDNFRDVRTLELQPDFEDYVKEAFKPLGVYINFWQPKLDAGAKHTFRIMLVNDTPQAINGKLRLVLQPSAGGAAVAHAETVLAIPALGQADYDMELAVPNLQGEFLLQASANPGSGDGPTLSGRKVTLTEASH
jgi:hypothetical protein